jgi:hypothetical protein
MRSFTKKNYLMWGTLLTNATIAGYLTFIKGAIASGAKMATDVYSANQTGIDALLATVRNLLQAYPILWIVVLGIVWAVLGFAGRVIKGVFLVANVAFLLITLGVIQ